MKNHTSKAKLPKPIALSFCCGDMIHADFAFSMAMLYGYCIGKGMNACVDKVLTTTLCFGRNVQVHRALGIGASHILFMDSDMVFPANALERLLNHNKDIVGATYSQRRSPRWVTHRTADGQRSFPFDGRTLFKVDSLGMGLVLVKSSVFTTVKRPWFQVTYPGTIDPHTGLDEHTSEDISFYNAARAAGFNVWCDYDLSKDVKHIGTFPYGLEHVEVMPTYLTE